MLQLFFFILTKIKKTKCVDTVFSFWLQCCCCRFLFFFSVFLSILTALTGSAGCFSALVTLLPLPLRFWSALASLVIMLMQLCSIKVSFHLHSSLHPQTACLAPWLGKHSPPCMWLDDSVTQWFGDSVIWWCLLDERKRESSEAPPTQQNRPNWTLRETKWFSSSGDADDSQRKHPQRHSHRVQWARTWTAAECDSCFSSGCSDTQSTGCLTLRDASKQFWRSQQASASPSSRQLQLRLCSKRLVWVNSFALVLKREESSWRYSHCSAHQLFSLQHVWQLLPATQQKMLPCMSRFLCLHFLSLFY